MCTKCGIVPYIVIIISVYVIIVILSRHGIVIIQPISSHLISLGTGH